MGVRLFWRESVLDLPNIPEEMGKRQVETLGASNPSVTGGCDKGAPLQGLVILVMSY